MAYTYEDYKKIYQSKMGSVDQALDLRASFDGFRAGYDFLIDFPDIQALPGCEIRQDVFMPVQRLLDGFRFVVLAGFPQIYSVYV